MCTSYLIRYIPSLQLQLQLRITTRSRCGCTRNCRAASTPATESYSYYRIEVQTHCRRRVTIFFFFFLLILSFMHYIIRFGVVRTRLYEYFELDDTIPILIVQHHYRVTNQPTDQRNGNVLLNCHRNRIRYILNYNH